MSVTFLGDAEKRFDELVEGDQLYYIDPKKPTEINFLPIKSVTPWEKKKGWVVVEYYQSSQAIDLGAHLSTIPTRKIIAEGKAKRITTMSLPPTVYFTNKRALEKFMGKR